MENKTERANLVKYWLTGLCVAFTLVSAVLANRLADYGMGFNWIAPTATFVFMFSVGIDNISTEVFGWKYARSNMIIGFVAEAFMVGVFALGMLIPAAPWVDDAAWTYVLGNTWRVVLASLVAYVVSSLINSLIIVKMKKKMVERFGSSNKLIGIRTCISSIIAQLFDATIFTTIAFAGTENFAFGNIYRQAIIKWVIALIWVAIEIPVIGRIKDFTGCDALEADVKLVG